MDMKLKLEIEKLSNREALVKALADEGYVVTISYEKDSWNDKHFLVVANGQKKMEIIAELDNPGGGTN